MTFRVSRLITATAAALVVGVFEANAIVLKWLRKTLKHNDLEVI